jgi:N-methylhydantoinase A
VLGRIAADQLVGGEMHLDVARAAAAVDRVAARLRLDRTAAAAGIVRVANASMERAIRVVSVERGHDPRDFALVAFGGCGGLHACEIANELGIRAVVVPEHAGALSALGMLLADRVRDYAAGVLGRSDITRRFAALERQARRDMPGARIERRADLRYAGQSYELTVPWTANAAERAFHREHQRVYGYANAGKPVEIVTVRVRATLAVARPRWLRKSRIRIAQQPDRRPIWVAGKWRLVAVYRRAQLDATDKRGPALVVDYGATTLIPPGWRFAVDAAGNLVGRRD